jgi:hypothetical protein
MTMSVPSTAPSARPIPPDRLEVEDGIGDTAILRGIESANEAERDRGHEKDGDARSLVVDAAGRGESLALLRRHAQDAAKPLAMDKSKEEQAGDEQRERSVIGDNRLGHRRPGLADEGVGTI